MYIYFYFDIGGHEVLFTCLPVKNIISRGAKYEVNIFFQQLKQFHINKICQSKQNAYICFIIRRDVGILCLDNTWLLKSIFRTFEVDVTFLITPLKLVSFADFKYVSYFIFTFLNTFLAK